MLPGADEGFAQLMRFARIGNGQRTAGSVKIVRAVFLVVVSALLARYAWDIVQARP